MTSILPITLDIAQPGHPLENPHFEPPKMQAWEKNIYLFQEWFSEYTLRKINMEPENTLLEKENHLPNHRFQVYVNLRGCKQGLLWIVFFPFSTCMVNKHHLWSVPMLPYAILGCPRKLGSKDNLKWVITPIYLVGGFNPVSKIIVKMWIFPK